jgi:hypothetical protein
LLVIDDRIPRKALGAGYPRANALLHALLPTSERLTFYPLVFPAESADDPYAELDPRMEVLMGRGYAGLAATLIDYSNLGFDVMWVSRPENMRFVDEVLRQLPGMRERWTIVYDAEAVYAPRTQQMFALRGTPMDPAYADAEFVKEIALAGRADMLVSVSVGEAATLRAHTGRPTYLLGFTSIAEPTPALFAQRRDFGFVGGIRPDSPNEDALLWYAANVMHEVRARTDALLQVAGFIDSPSVLFYDGEDMRIQGPLPNLWPFFDAIRVFVAPTRFAAGLLLAQALGWRDDVELLVADDAPTFAAQCERLYGAPALWQNLRTAALEAVHVRYGSGVFESELAQIVDAVRARRGTAPLASPQV